MTQVKTRRAGTGNQQGEGKNTRNEAKPEKEADISKIKQETDDKTQNLTHCLVRMILCSDIM